MHILDDGTLALSPSDLTGFSACEHLVQLELSATRGERERAGPGERCETNHGCAKKSAVPGEGRLMEAPNDEPWIRT